MKKIFYYLLPLLLLNQSGTAQQDSLTLRITDEKGQIIIGAVVLQYPESYLLGASNEKGEVEIKGLHIPARQQLVFQCLGYEMKALPFQEVKQHPNVRLKEKITELPEAVVLAHHCLDFSLSLTNNFTKNTRRKKNMSGIMPLPPTINR